MKALVAALWVLLISLTAAAQAIDANAGDAPAKGESVNQQGLTRDANPRTTLETVEEGVQLEIVEWGGNGATMVLLAGLGDNAHVYDQFALLPGPEPR